MKGWGPGALSVHFRLRLRPQHLQGQERAEFAGLDECVAAEISSPHPQSNAKNSNDKNNTS